MYKRCPTLRKEHKYEFAVTMPKHPDQTNARDPRRVWLYECLTGANSVENNVGYGIATTRTYYFQNESDLMLFLLR